MDAGTLETPRAPQEVEHFSLRVAQHGLQPCSEVWVPGAVHGAANTLTLAMQALCYTRGRTQHSLFGFHTIPVLWVSAIAIQSYSVGTHSKGWALYFQWSQDNSSSIGRQSNRELLQLPGPPKYPRQWPTDALFRDKSPLLGILWRSRALLKSWRQCPPPLPAWSGCSDSSKGFNACRDQ